MRKHGNGTMYYANGDYFSGLWRDNFPGEGEYLKKNGALYKG